MNSAEKILITGARGFVGKNLRRMLSVNDDKSVITIDRHEDVFQDVLKHFVGDLSSAAALSPIPSDIDAVVHLAADVDVGNMMTSWRDNVLATLNLVRWAKRTQVKRIIYISSAAVYSVTESGQSINELTCPFPKSPYGVSKFLGELIVRLYLPTAVIIRFPYLYGDGDVHGALPRLISNIRDGKPLKIRNEERDYLHVEDAVRAIIDTLDYSGKSRLFAFGSGEMQFMRSIALSVAEAYHQQIRIVLSGERLNGRVDYRFAAKELGWQPKIEFSQGLAALLPQEASIRKEAA